MTPFTRPQQKPKKHWPAKLGVRPLCGKRPKLGFKTAMAEKQAEVECFMCQQKIKKGLGKR